MRLRQLITTHSILCPCISSHSQRPEYSNRVADNALLLLLEGCRIGSVPGWGGARITMLHCVTALRSLIENVQVSVLQVLESDREID